MAGEVTGKNAYVAFKGTQYSLYRSFSPEQTIDMVDKSSGSDASKTYLTTLADGSASVELVMQEGTAGTAAYANLAPGGEGTLEWGVEGTSAGKVRHYVNAIVKSRSEPFKYNDLSLCNAAFQYSGAVTDGTY